MTVQEGDQAEFVCEVSKEDATVKWFLDGQEILPDDRYHILSDGRTHRLIIDDALLPDAGEITARVEDEQTTATLTVEGKVVFMVL